MSNYYIVALNKSGPRIVNLNNDILKEDEEKLHSIEYIDYITNKYDEEAFKKFLFNKKIIDNVYNPIYIVKSHLYKGNRKLKYYDLIFKSSYSDFLNKIALTTIRNRAITYGDAARLLDIFEHFYFNDEEFNQLSQESLNEHQVNRLMKDINNKSSNELNYTTLRNIISALYQYEKHHTYEYYAYNNYKREDYENEILHLLPKENKSNVKKVIERYDFETLDKIKHDKWDNEKAQKLFENNAFSIEMLSTLTLEDLYRAGFIDYLEYERIRIEKESKFHK